jgi:hypothetical protein
MGAAGDWRKENHPGIVDKLRVGQEMTDPQLTRNLIALLLEQNFPHTFAFPIWFTQEKSLLTIYILSL